MRSAQALGMASFGGLVGCPDVGGRWLNVDPTCTEEPDGATDDAGTEDAGPLPGASKVVEVLRQDSVVEEQDQAGRAVRVVQPERVQSMLDAALAAISDGAANPWTALLADYHPKMRIGLKTNCLNATLPTSSALLAAIIASLQRHLGVDPTTIVIWDRRLDELTRNSDYRTEVFLGAQILGTVNSTTDAGGPGYTEGTCGNVEGATPRLSKILTELTDVTINCPVLKTHDVSGVTAAMKNIYGIIDNPGSYHENLQTALPTLYRLPAIRRHIRLTIVDALVTVTAGSTSSLADTSARRLLVSRDPVAIDAYALDLVNRLRAAKDPPLANISASVTGWIEHAYALGLGTKQYDLVAIEQA